MTVKRQEGRISEDASEKRKRGRPRKHPEELVYEVLNAQDAKTARGAVEYLLGAASYAAIVDAWKADPAGSSWAEYYIGKDGKGPAGHKSIMAALGRIEDEEDRLATARIIADKKLSTRAAVAAVRRARLGREDKPDFPKLVQSLEVALDTYQAAHPSTPADMLIRALRFLADYNEDGGKE